MREAGFQHLKILQEKNYAIDYIISEPETKENINRLGIALEEVKEAANSVVSISVFALKE